MRELLTCLLFALTPISFAEQPNQVRTVKLGWDYPITPPDNLTNYVFYIRGSTNATAPLPWPIVSEAPGTTNTQVSVTGTIQFFYCTVTNITSSPTNFWVESDPSGTVRWCVTPSGTLSIAP